MSLQKLFLAVCAVIFAGCATDASVDVFTPDMSDGDARTEIYDGTDGDLDGLVGEDNARDAHDQDLIDIPDGTDSEIRDAHQDADLPDDGANITDLPDASDPCLHCPGQICDPETLECLECINDIHCGSGSWCDDGTCRPHLCSPGALFCHETMLHRCSENGGGFTIIMDCNDNNLCTEGDRCENGKCVDGTPIDCADDNPCTLDYCTGAGECEHYMADQIVCDDGNPCTENDMCHLGICIPGSLTRCSDNNSCTLDYCTQRTGCIHEPVTGQCMDSNGCTTSDRCIEGRCSGTDRDCDDFDPCTTDFCTQDACAHEQITGCQGCLADNDCPAPRPCETGICDTETGTCLVKIKRTDGCCLLISDCPETPPCTRSICDTNHRCVTGTLDQPGCCENNVMQHDFSAGVPENWDISNDNFEAGWQIGTLPESIEDITAPALYFGNDSETSYDVGVPISGTVRTAPVGIPAASAAKLIFDTWQDVFPIGGFDTFEIHVRSQTALGEQRDLLWKRPEDFPLRSVETVKIDISAYSGRIIEFEFYFDTVDEIDNHGRGIYLDNIEVLATCTRLGCITDVHCKSAGLNGFCTDGRCNFSQSWIQVGTFGQAGSGTGQFTSATDLVVTPGPEGIGNQIVVSDNRTHYVQVFDPEGGFVRSFGGYGVTAGRFLAPLGMAASDNKIFIADSRGGRVQVMTPAGVFLYSFGSAGIDPGQFDTPRGVAASADGETLFVADTGNHRISVFNRLGVYLFSFGTYGLTDGRFRTPSDVAVTEDGNIWVADTKNNRIQVFSPKGILQQVIAPDEPGFLHYPGGIAALPDGGAVVADTYNHRLVLVNADGTVRDILGSFGSGSGEFNYPSDVDVINDGGEIYLVVADAGNYRITTWAIRMW